jgi:serine/threonine protein kinase
MEYCAGGDLFSYIEKRGFRLPENRAGQIMHKLSTAVFYIHSYGIAHRDLKPENILMTDNTEQADIRLLDFGLSKIIGPNEFCTEPYGTLVSHQLTYSPTVLLKY